jgi:hypothetical protein
MLTTATAVSGILTTAYTEVRNFWWDIVEPAQAGRVATNSP